jgi:hypothetical protein
VSFFRALGETTKANSMIAEHFYFTDLNSKRRGPFTAMEIAELRSQGKIASDWIVTDSFGVRMIESFHQELSENSRHPPPPLPPPIPSSPVLNRPAPVTPNPWSRRVFWGWLALMATKALVNWIFPQRTKSISNFEEDAQWNRSTDASAQWKRMMEQADSPKKFDDAYSNSKDSSPERKADNHD